jgi:hypothetical protein
MKMSDVNYMENLVDGMNCVKQEASSIKHVKCEKGLIERTESSKIILAEDNRQVLLG